MRSWLRMTGVLLIAMSLAAVPLWNLRAPPDVLVAEDGRLVALVGQDQLASNRSRPSQFIFDQWRYALKRQSHDGPKWISDVEGELPIPDSFWEFEKPIGRPGFRCVRKRICLGRSDSGVRVSIVEDLALLGMACDQSDIVITSRRIHMEPAVPAQFSSLEKC